MLDRVKKKLAGWKANLLSMAGRRVLIQASPSTIPTYAMQNVQLSDKILKGINRVNRNFLWGSIENSKKMHWVGWDKVTTPKDRGGLGLQSTKGRNTALLAKLNWRFHSEDNAPWVKVLKLKYGTMQHLNSRNEAKLPGSPIWKGLKKGEHVFKEGMKWISGHESNLDFWLDSWSDLGPFRSIIHDPIPLESTNLKVKDVFHGWNWSDIPFDLPLDIKESIKAVPLPLHLEVGIS